RNLEKHGVWNAEAEARIEPGWRGDLGAPRFGLSETAFEQLAGAVDAVYHAGAWVNFTYPYRVLEPINVEGTREALRLATLGGVRPFHFVSSTAVFTPETYAEGPAREDDPLERTEGLFGGYGETKWVAEKTLAIARERGLPVAIYRPGVIAGHSRTGAGNTSDMVWSLLKGSIQLGLVVDAMPPLDVSPVDYVARAIVHLSLRDAAFEGAFQFANPRPIPWQEIIATMIDMGWPLRRTGHAEWLRALAKVAREGGDNALVPFLPLFGELEAGDAAAADAPVFATTIRLHASGARGQRYRLPAVRPGAAAGGISSIFAPAVFFRRRVERFSARPMMPSAPP
ncbi:MAG: NAD-dependent epimerase/dehydratase family protein, partial [Thermoanaerobaculia bacterium]|nr:NAD-dependent epimerase/dehydratase family protein [Thermoanaerobaculia bacterium]